MNFNSIKQWIFNNRRLATMLEYSLGTQQAFAVPCVKLLANTWFSTFTVNVSQHFTGALLLLSHL